MKSIIEILAPSGEEGLMRDELKRLLRGKFDEFSEDNMGNLIAKSGDGSLCVECGMDSLGIMVVSRDEKGVRLCPVGEIKARNIIEKNVVFFNGVSGKICCDEGVDIEKAKISDLYADVDSDKLKIGDFGRFMPEFEENDCEYSAFGIGNCIGLAAVCKAVETADTVGNVTVLFSAQKCLGARGLQAFFRNNSFERILTVGKSEDDGCTVVAKDARAVSDRCFKAELENIAEKSDVPAQTVVSKQNFYLEQISISCGDPCAALGICVESDECGKETVNKSDFGTAVAVLTELLKG